MIIKIKIFEVEYLSGKKLIGKGIDIDNNLIYEIKDGKGYFKEYDYYGGLEFEGDYLNGERSGKGKEYWDGHLVFEGEYLNGEKWNGKRTDYYYGGDLHYEFEYLNGKINGIGKEYYDKNKLRFNGEYLNGKRHGKGKEYVEGLLIFDGEYLDGKKWNGKGFDGNNNLIYELKDGKGYIYEFGYYGGL